MNDPARAWALMMDDGTVIVDSVSQSRAKTAALQWKFGTGLKTVRVEVCKLPRRQPRK